MDVDSRLHAARRNVMKSLGKNYHTYLEIMKKWFRKKIDKAQLDNEIRQCLSFTQIHFHNEFILTLLAKSIADKNVSPLSSGTTEIQNLENDKKGLDEFIHINPQILHEQLSYRATNERFLPDNVSIYGRFMMCAWENDLEDFEDPACKLIIVASNVFMKNILTAVISRRSGFKTHRGHFTYNHGIPMPNPWLRNTANYSTQPSYSTKACKTEEGFTVKTPDHKKVEQDIIFQLSSSSSANNVTRKVPINVDDIIDTLKVHKHIIASQMMYSIFMEKLIAARYHPSREDDEYETNMN